MSVSEAAVEGQDVSAGETHDGDSPDTGGSQVADDVSAVGDDGDGTVNAGEEPATETVEPETEKAPTAAVSAEEWAEAQAELVAARQFRDEIKEEARVNPEFAKHFQPKGADATKDYRSRMAAVAEEQFEPVNGKALEAYIEPMREEIADLRRQLGRVDSTAGRTAQTQAQRDFRAGLVEAKVPVDNPAFAKIQKDLRRDPDFVQGEAQGKPWALRATVDAWHASAGRKAVSGDQRARVEAAKSGRSPRPGGVAATADRVVKMDVPYDAERAFAIRNAAVKAGKPMPKFEWLKEK